MLFAEAPMISAYVDVTIIDAAIRAYAVVIPIRLGIDTRLHLFSRHSLSLSHALLSFQARV
jgi:hypothetical protein